MSPVLYMETVLFEKKNKKHTQNKEKQFRVLYASLFFFVSIVRVYDFFCYVLCIVTAIWQKS